MDLRIRNVRKDYGNFLALDDVSIDIRSGELVALLGPSGSGKTTLLRAIAGLETIDAGQVLFGGRDASEASIQERNVGFVFQHYALFRHMTVADNVAFGLRARDKARRPTEAAIRKKVQDLLELIQLPDLGKRYPAQLSGGQRQRVALARALAIEPRFLLLDEPFGALDAQVRKDLRRWLREIHDETGHTTVFVTHDQEEALELADRVAVLNKGRLEQIGAPDEIYDRPATPFVYAFIGDSSFLPIEVRAGEALFDRAALPLGRVTAPDGAARLHVRPQDVQLRPTGDGVSGRVTLVRRTGAFRRADIEIGEGRQRIEAQLPPEAGVSEGDLVGVHFDRYAIFPRAAAT